jgi:hypothetical protein
MHLSVSCCHLLLQVLPSGTVAAEDEKAADSAFAAGETVVVDGDEVRLQQLSFDIPAGSDLTGERASQ